MRVKPGRRAAALSDQRHPTPASSMCAPQLSEGDECRQRQAQTFRSSRSTRGPALDEVHVVHIAGEVDMSHEEELRGELRAAVAADPKGIVVDLTECEFIDSSGVRALLPLA